MDKPMSETIVDLAKVTQMLDSGWRVTVYKDGLNTYTVEAEHDNDAVMDRCADRLFKEIDRNVVEEIRDTVKESVFETSDFTPEQALTRMAYKILGDII